MRTKTKLLSILAFCVLPLAVQANAGTPLMWATMLHLVFGNAIIGIFEGLLLAWMFHASKLKSILFLILANYTSAWFGRLLITSTLADQLNISIENFRMWFWLLVTITFFITLVIEFPFFLIALWKSKSAAKRATLAVLLIHGISYLLLFGWYWLASGTSMITQLSVIPASQIQIPGTYSLYYISQDGHEILKANLNGHLKEKVKEVNAHGKDSRLFVRPALNGTLDLYLYLQSEQTGKEKEELILQDFASLASIDWRISENSSSKSEGTWFNFGPAASLSPKSDWEYFTGFEPIEGVHGNNEKDKKRFHFSLETPFVSWNARNATLIEENFLVFQLGNDQICILQPQNRKIALLARGKGPVVAEVKKTNKIPLFPKVR